MINIWNILRRNSGGENAMNSPTRRSPKRRNTQTSPGHRSQLIGVVVNQSPTNVELQKTVEIDELINPPPNLRESKSEIDPPQNLRELDSHATSLQTLLKDEPILPKSISSHYRSHADIALTNAKILKGLSFPHGMPLGPYKTFEEIFSKINDWAKDVNTGGGSFSIVKNSKNAATAQRGAARLLTCSCAGTSRSKLHSLHPLDVSRPNQKPSIKTDCKWAIYVEELMEGWMVTHPPESSIHAAEMSENNELCIVHNHDLCKTEASKILYSNLREIPEMVDNYANFLKKGGMSSSMIYHALVQECLEKDVDVTITPQDIRNKYGSPASESILDCTNLHVYLMQRLSSDPSLEYDIYIDESGKMERIFLLYNNGCNFGMK